MRMLKIVDVRGSPTASNLIGLLVFDVIDNWWLGKDHLILYLKMLAK